MILRRGSSWVRSSPRLRREDFRPDGLEVQAIRGERRPKSHREAAEPQAAPCRPSPSAKGSSRSAWWAARTTMASGSSRTSENLSTGGWARSAEPSSTCVLPAVKRSRSWAIRHSAARQICRQAGRAADQDVGEGVRRFAWGFGDASEDREGDGRRRGDPCPCPWTSPWHAPHGGQMGGKSENMKTSKIHGTRASNSCGRAHGFRKSVSNPLLAQSTIRRSELVCEPRRTEWRTTALLGGHCEVFDHVGGDEQHAMSVAEPQSAVPKPKLRWYQFSLRTLLVFVGRCLLFRAVGWA